MDIQKNGTKLIFVEIEEFDNKTVSRGAFLLANLETKPLEFRCTTPIRPTSLQKLLYGGVLDKHIKVDLIGLALMKCIKENNSVILVRDRRLLEMRPHLDIPVIALSKDDEIDTSSAKDGISANDKEVLPSEGGKFEPILISVHKDYLGEREEWRSRLSEVFKSHNLLEPFDRISAALNQIHKEDEKK